MPVGCRDYGTNVVGGVTPGKGGTEVDGIPGIRQLLIRHVRRPAPTPR